MLLQQITFVSFFLLALSSLCQVSGYRYRPRQDVHSCVAAGSENGKTLRAELVKECRQDSCRKIIQYINDVEVASIPLVGRKKQSDMCDESGGVAGAPCIITDGGQEFVSQFVHKTGNHRITLELSSGGVLLNCIPVPQRSYYGRYGYY